MRAPIFALLLVLISVTAQADMCEVRQLNSPSGQPRILRVEFPGGRWLEVVGHVHGDRGLAATVATLPDSGATYIPQLAGLVAQVPSVTMTHFHEDLSFVRDAISKGAGFVGLETTPEQVLPLIQRVLSLKSRVVGHLGPGPTVDLVHRAVLMTLGAPGWLAANEPALFKDTVLVGFERIDDHSDDRKESAGEVAALKELMLSAKDEPLWQQKFMAAESLLAFTIYPHFSENPEFAARVRSTVLADAPLKYRPLVENYLTQWLAYMRKLNMRDTRTALNMAGIGRSGIHLIGALHAMPIAQKLRALCDKQRAKAS